MTCNFLASLKLNHIQKVHNLMMVQMTECLSIDFQIWYLTPFLYFFILCLVLEHGNFVMDHISYQVKFISPLFV